MALAFVSYSKYKSQYRNYSGFSFSTSFFLLTTGGEILVE